MMWTKEQIEARRDMWVRSEVHSAPVMNTEYLELCRLALRGLEHEERAERAEAEVARLYLERCQLSLRGLEQEERAGRAESEVERLQEALDDLRDTYDRLMVRAEEAESEAAAHNAAATQYEQDIAILRQENAQLRAQTSWQPIETAPRDRKVIVTKITNGVVGFITEAHWLSGATGGSLVYAIALDAATHWMPVPASAAKE